MRACFFLETPPDERDCRRFGFELLKKRGYAVKVADLSAVLRPEYPAVMTPPGIDLFRCADRGEAERLVREERDGIAVLLTSYRPETRWLYASFKDHGLRTAQFCSNRVPTPPRLSPGRVKRLFGPNVARALLKKPRNWWFRKQPNWAAGVRGPRWVLRGGRLYSRNFPKPEPDTEMVFAHSLDYDIYLEQKRAPKPAAAERTAVFLDEDFPQHKDYKLDPDADPGLDPDAYYGGLDRTFGRIERELGLTVVVAAHPSADASHFGGRRWEKGRTADLVAGADLVLAHSSTSLGFAILHRKPVVFLTSGPIDKAYQGSFIRFAASLLGKTPVPIDRDVPVDWEREMRVDRDAYGRYVADYIKVPGTPEKPFWDIAADRWEGR